MSAIRTWLPAAAGALLVLSPLAAAADLGAQGIAERVSAVRSGTVRMEYAAREGVCGNGRGSISVRTGTGSSSYSTGTTRQREWEDECEPGPVRVALDVDRGTVTAVRAYVGGNWRGSADLDLGTVPAQQASDYLMDIAERADARPAKDAIFPASIAEGVTLWPRLLTLAKDTDRPRDVRNSAVFWVSQAAGEAATKGLQEIVDDPRGDREVRKSAVFSLSQRPKDESVPALINIARTHRDPEIRRSAIFWLGQSKDARAIRYFEDVLVGK
jgi:hypothetical protein